MLLSTTLGNYVDTPYLFLSRLSLQNEALCRTGNRRTVGLDFPQHRLSEIFEDLWNETVGRVDVEYVRDCRRNRDAGAVHADHVGVERERCGISVEGPDRPQANGEVG